MDTGFTDIDRLWHATPSLPDSPPLNAVVGSRINLPPSSTDRIIGRVVSSTGVLVPHTTSSSYVTQSTQTVIYAYAGVEYEFVLIYNDSGSTIERGASATYKAGVADGKVRTTPTSHAAGLVVGFALWDIPTGTYGYLLTRGRCKVIRGATANANTGFKPDASTAGRVTDISAGQELCGFFLSVAGSAGDLEDAYVSCRY